MKVRPSNLFAAYTALCLVLLAFICADARRCTGGGLADRASRRALVGALHLTDLALFTEARYTRHPSMADRHTPFQDHPLSLEHFPSGSLISPPRHVRSHGTH